MAAVPEQFRKAAWTVWRALALAGSLGLTRHLLRLNQIDFTLAGGAAAVWLLIGWNTARPALAGSITAAVVLAAAVLAWHLSWAAASFVPIWAALFWLPLAFRRGGTVARLCRLLRVAAAALDRVASAACAWLGRFARSLEALRLLLAIAAGFASIRPFLHDGIMGGVDAQWYTSVVEDHLQQWRMGMGPVFVGQTRFAAMGAVMPLRVAPYLQHLTLAIDVLTGRGLSAYMVLNLAVILSCVGGCVSAYLCLRQILPSRRFEALALAVVYAWSPAVAGLAYTGQLLMSVMTLPYLPIVFAGLARIFTRDGFAGWAMITAGCAACWLAHSPIGFWVSACAAFAVILRWLSMHGPSLREAGRAAAAGALFLGLCGYVFVSLRVIAPPATPPTLASMLQPIMGAMFPAALEPVSPSSRYRPRPDWRRTSSPAGASSWRCSRERRRRGRRVRGQAACCRLWRLCWSAYPFRCRT
jgi:hypothetical protein